MRNLTLLAVLGLSFVAPLVASACSGDDTVGPSDAGGSDVALDTYVPPDASGDDAQPVDAGPDTADAAPCPATSGALPDDLFCTGLYDPTTKTVAADVRPFTPGLVFWSDGAQKSRWIYLPPGSQIDTTDMDEWVFPVGTKVWKEFKLGGKKIETRLLQKGGGGVWLATTYRWSDDQTTATKFEDGAQLPGLAIDGGIYEIPQQAMCSQCHQGRKDFLLGFEALSLGLPTASGVTLDVLKTEGRLTSPPATTTTSLPEDTTNKAASALGWLHINCGVCCHNPGQNSAARFTGLFMRLGTHDVDGGPAPTDATQTSTYLTAVGVAVASPSYNSPASPFHSYTHRITKQNLADSLIPAVDATRGAGQMPPLVTHTADSAGVQAVSDWITAMP